MSSDKKSVTFIMVGNRQGAPRRLVLPVAWLKAAMVGGLILGLIVVAMSVDYFGLLVQTIENKRLKAENTRLRSQFQVVEGKLNALENSLERVKNFSKKLRLITNVDDEDRELKLAIGPLPKTGQAFEEFAEPIEGRGPAHAVGKPDEPFFTRPALDFDKGELSLEGQRDYASLAVRIDKSVKETQMREQSILDLWEGLSERQSLLNATPSTKPTRGWFTSKFGYRVSPFTGRPVMHNGVDIAAPPGALVHAPADGIVSFAGYDAGYGKLVAIDHGYGVVTRYGHNSMIFVKIGQKVKRRDVVSAVGNTGRSTGPHLHYEVRVNNVPVDPTNYILVE
jgi:murein DD-endopeptidase MepM/ murein hydrolase activator NlpD